MKSLLTGNGINIQFDRNNYTTQQIVLRILKNCDRDDFPKHIIVDYSYLLKNYLGELYLKARDIIEGLYDDAPNCSAEKKAIASFKKQYADRITILRITDIGFEDYYLIHDLLCHKMNVQNPDMFYIRESMKTAYLLAIYNDGKLEELHTKYPKGFISSLSDFDNIFTTNYDTNIELATGKNVYHIHGQFDKKADVYDKESFRNQLPDCPIKDYIIDERYYYLYSNALSTHCGEYKELQVKQHSQANDCVEKMAHAYNTDVKMREEIDSWTKEDNMLTANLGFAIQLKAANPQLHFSENYHYDKLQSISGQLDIIGLSPWNDFHIFESIDNSNIECCKYYFFDESECEIVKLLLPKLSKANLLVFEAVSSFWRICDEK